MKTTTTTISYLFLFCIMIFYTSANTLGQTTVNFNYTGGAQTWTVPPCVTSIAVNVQGAEGGGPSTGNNGATVTATIAVTPGQILQINVGGQGTQPGAGWNGGGAGATASGAGNTSYGGGGASDIRIGPPYTLGNRVVVAAGGGGTGGGDTDGLGGQGGCAAGAAGDSPFGQGGYGGSQTAGGTGGPPWIASGNYGANGGLGTGGAGASDPCYNVGPGGGGGGGYYGGGGGGSDCWDSPPLGGGGGGGGSSLTPAGGVCSAGTSTGAGFVSITYTVGAVVSTATNTGPYCAGATIQLNANAGGTGYAWTGPGAYTNTIQNPTRPASTTAMGGIYTVTVTYAGGCTSSATTTVVVNALPIPTATNTGPYCAGATIQLNSPTGSATDDWTGPGGYIQNNIQNPTIAASTLAMSGTYTVTVTNAAGCSATATTAVVVNALPIPTANNTGPYCAGATIQLNSPTGSATDDWTGPGGYVQNNTQNPTRPASTVAMSGTYTVTVTNAAGCSATATTAVVVNALPVPTATNTGPYCAGAAIALNGGGSGTYAWSGPSAFSSTLASPTIASSTIANGGTYTVTVTSASGCTSSTTNVVTVNALPIPTASNTGPYCSGSTIQLNSPTGSVTDDWTGPGGYIQNNMQNPTIVASTPAMSGTYTVSVTNAAGCSATATTAVIVNAAAVATASNTGPYCVGASINLSSGAGAIDYDWTGPGGYVQNNTQNPTIGSSTLAMTGVYTVSITLAGGCTGTATTTVAVNANPTPTANNTGPYCAGATIQLNSPTGSATDDWMGPIGYVQNNMQNPAIATSTTAMSGTYTVTVTNAAGCSATATTALTVNANPTPTANNTGPYCAGVTIQLNSPTGSATDDWAGPGAYIQNNLQNPTIAVSTSAMSGIYTLTVTNSVGCSATATTAVTVNANPTPTANNTGPYCAGVTIQLNSPTGSTTDDWIGPGGYIQNNSQNPAIAASTTAMSGTYTVTVTNAAGCSATATTVVIVNANPTPTANNTGPYCNGMTIQLNSPTGSATDDWTGPGGYIQNNMQNPMIAASTTAMSGIYTVTVTNAVGCSATATTGVTVNANASPTSNNTGPYCAGATINLSSGAGGIDYDWTGPGGYVQNNTQNPTIAASTVAMSGVYTVTMTVTGGCTGTASTSVTVNPLPIPTANNTGPYCVGATIQLNSPTGSAADDWTGPYAYLANNIQNPSIAGSTVVMGGTYTVSVTDMNGCNATATTNVVVNALPVPTANNTGPYCVGAMIQLNSPTGSATDDWIGPSAFVQNNIQNPGITVSTFAMNGVYTVSVTDMNGCNATATTNVVVNSLPVPTANNTGPYCDGATMDLSSNGGIDYDWTGPNSFVVNNTQNGAIPNVNPLMSGTYTVTVTDGNGCVSTAGTIVVVNPLPTPTANNTGPYCDGATMDLSSNGGVDYDWAGPNSFVVNNTQDGSIPNVNPIMSGTYTVTVTDANGCVSTATTAVTINALPNAVASNNAPICELQNINFNSGGGIDYDWAGPGGYNQPNTQNPSIMTAPIISAGVYTVTVTDANGCVSIATTTVVINSNLVFTASSSSPICSGSLLNLIAENILGASYDWIGPNSYDVINTQNPTIPGATSITAGIYTVTATAATGCTGTATVNVVINEIPNPTLVGDVLSGCVPVCVNFTDQSTVVGSTIASWNWDIEGQTSSIGQNVNYCFNNIGVYDASITVTSAAGCTATQLLPNYINVVGMPVADFMYTPKKISIFQPDVIFGNTSGGATTYAWDFGDGETSTSINPTHTYSDTGYYCVNLLAVNSFGCSDTTMHCFNVKPEFTIYIPNTFTVNDDGLNETWDIHGIGIKTISVRVFDRFGEEIFFFDDIEKGWNGNHHNGNPCKQDVYVYRIDVIDGYNDYHEYYGSVNLIR